MYPGLHPTPTVFSKALAGLTFLGIILSSGTAATESSTPILRADDFKHYVDSFNRTDQELYPQHVPNTQAWAFLRDNIPLLECPDQNIERTYYFRWWTFRKHLKQTPEGFVITSEKNPTSRAANTVDAVVFMGLIGKTVNGCALGRD